MEDSATEFLKALSSSKSQFTEESLTEVLSDLALLRSVLEDVTLNPPRRSLMAPVTTQYGVAGINGFGNISQTTTTALQDFMGVRNKDISSIFMPTCQASAGAARVPCANEGILAGAQLTTSMEVQPANYLSGLSSQVQRVIDQGSGLDAVFVPTWESKPDRYVLMYSGANSGGAYRAFPFTDFRGSQTSETACRTSPTEPLLGTRFGYDPRCRDWYNQARLGLASPIFTAPYVDAFSGLLVLTAAQSYFYSTTPLASSFAGAVAIDFKINDIEQSIQNTTILENGYGFIINYLGEPIMHTAIDRDAALPTIEDLEFPDGDAAEITEFKTMIKSIIDDVNAQTQATTKTAEFTRGGDKFFVAYSPVQVSNWIVVLVVPEDDVLQGARQVASDIREKVTVLIVIFVVVLVICVVASYFGTTKLMKHIVSPIDELIAVTTRLVNNDTTADKSLDTVNRSCAEIDALLDTYKHFVTALLFGNTTLMSGDLDRAMEIYEKALALFTSTGNTLAEGSCRNNMAAVHMKRKAYERAEIEYQNAIDVGEDLLKKAETSDVARNYFALLIGRVFNKGRMFQEMAQSNAAAGTAPQAEELLYRALRLEQNTRHHENFVTRACAYGFFLLDTSDARCGTDLERANKAECAFSEALVAAMEVQNVDPSVQTGCIQEAALGLGISWMIQGKVYNDMNRIASAKLWLQYCLETGAQIAPRTNARALDALVQCGMALNDQQLVQILQPLAQTAVQARKVRRFVLALDISGSMAGSRITKAVAAMDSVFDRQVSLEHNDMVTLITFNSSLTTVFRLGAKSQVQANFKHFVANPPRPSNMTALWDAIGTSFQVLDNDARFRDIIVVLTDGDDTTSNRYQYSQLEPLAVASPANLFIVGVGREIASQTQQQLQTLCKHTTYGGYYAAQETNQIAETFAKVEEDINRIDPHIEAF